MILEYRNFAVHETLNILHVFPFVVLVDQRPRDTARTCAPGSPDSVHIGFRNVGYFEIDDVTDARNVNATRSDVRGNEDIQVACPEGFHGSVALGLGFVAVNGLGLDFVAFQVSDNLVCTVFGSGKYQRGFDFFLL